MAAKEVRIGRLKIAAYHDFLFNPSYVREQPNKTSLRWRLFLL